MKKIMKIIGIVLLVLLAGIIILLVCLNKRPAAPTDYQTKTKIGGELEANYMASGKYEVSTYEESVLQGFSKYILYYPSQLTEETNTYPVIVISNGSGTPLSKYPTVALSEITVLEFTVPQFKAMFGANTTLTENVVNWYSKYVNRFLFEIIHDTVGSGNRIFSHSKVLIKIFRLPGPRYF